MSISVKISQLNDGGNISSQDYIPAARGVDTVKIPAQQIVVNASNIGVGSGQVFSGLATGAGSSLLFRTLSGVDGVVVSNQGNTLVISASGQNPVRTAITGNGTTRTFAVGGTTSINPNNFRVDIDGVLQEPTADYSIVGTNIVFVDPPPNGSKVTVISNNLVRAFDIIPSDGSVTPQKLNLLSGNVGIGTNTPGANLQVIGSSTTQPAVIITGNTSTYWPQTSIWFNDTAVGGRSYSIGNGGTTGSFTIADQTAGQARLTIDSSGNVGIGVTNPDTLLQINGASNTTQTWNGGTNFIKLAAGGSWSEQCIAFQESTTNVGAKIGVKNEANGAYGIVFANRPNTSTTSALVERMRIDSSGNVGIGTTFPQQALHVQGNVRVGDATLTQPSGNAPMFACRAWVNFDGTGAIGTNQTIRSSGNVSSVFKDGNGNYRVFFATHMPDTNYAAIATSGDGVGTTFAESTATTERNTNYVRVYTGNAGASSAFNRSEISVVIFR